MKSKSYIRGSGEGKVRIANGRSFYPDKSQGKMVMVKYTKSSLIYY